MKVVKVTISNLSARLYEDELSTTFQCDVSGDYSGEILVELMYTTDDLKLAEVVCYVINYGGTLKTELSIGRMKTLTPKQRCQTERKKK